MIALRRSRRLDCSPAAAHAGLFALLAETASGPISVCSLPKLERHVCDREGSWERIVRLLRCHHAGPTGPQCVVAWEIRDAHACSRFSGVLALDAVAGSSRLNLEGTCETSTELGADLGREPVVRALAERTADALLERIAAHAGYHATVDA